MVQQFVVTALGGRLRAVQQPGAHLVLAGVVVAIGVPSQRPVGVRDVGMIRGGGLHRDRSDTAVLGTEILVEIEQADVPPEYPQVALDIRNRCIQPEQCKIARLAAAQQRFPLGPGQFSRVPDRYRLRHAVTGQFGGAPGDIGGVIVE